MLHLVCIFCKINIKRDFNMNKIIKVELHIHETPHVVNVYLKPAGEHYQYDGIDRNLINSNDKYYLKDFEQLGKLKVEESVKIIGHGESSRDVNLYFESDKKISKKSFKKQKTFELILA